MVTVNIGGKKFPLCLTVACLDKVNKLCGGLKGLTKYICVNDISTAAEHTAALLEILIAGGYWNQVAMSRILVQDFEKIRLPEANDLYRIMTPGNINAYRSAALDAITESLHQDIEAEHPKNGDAGQ